MMSPVEKVYTTAPLIQIFLLGARSTYSALPTSRGNVGRYSEVYVEPHELLSMLFLDNWELLMAFYLHPIRK